MGSSVILEVSALVLALRVVFFLLDRASCAPRLAERLAARRLGADASRRREQPLGPRVPALRARRCLADANELLELPAALAALEVVQRHVSSTPERARRSCSLPAGYRVV